MAGPRGLVFRDGVAVRAGASLLAELTADLTAARDPGGDPEARLVAPLISAAALEAALEDAGTGGLAGLRELTDKIAEAYWRRDTARLPARAPALPRLPERLRLSRPEGFAYYALQPRALGQAALRDAPAGAV